MSKFVSKWLPATKKFCEDSLAKLSEVSANAEKFKEVSGGVSKKESTWAEIVKAFGRNTETERVEFLDDFVGIISCTGFGALHSFFMLDDFEDLLQLYTIQNAEMDVTALTTDVLSGIPASKVPKIKKLARRLADVYVADDELDSDESVEDKSGAKDYLVTMLAKKLEEAVFGSEKAAELEATRLAEEEEEKIDKMLKKEKKKKDKKRKHESAKENGHAELSSPKKSKKEKEETPEEDPDADVDDKVAAEESSQEDESGEQGSDEEEESGGQDSDSE